MKRKTTLLIAISIVALIIFYYLKLNNSYYNLSNSTENVCYTSKLSTVHGNSLSPLINDSEKVLLLEGYYNCHNISRNDIVAFKLKTKPQPFVKIVKGLPNDTLEFRGSYAYINGKLLVNSEGKPYIFSERARRILSIPLINNKILDGTYLVLGNKIREEESFDSRYFGYISKDQIVGKVVKIKSS